jgi:hypothetical protein
MRPWPDMRREPSFVLKREPGKLRAYVLVNNNSEEKCAKPSRRWPAGSGLLGIMRCNSEASQDW